MGSAIPPVGSGGADAGAANADRVDQEAPHRVFFEQNPLPMWVWDAETLLLVDANEAALVRLGYGRAEFLRLRLPEICPAEAMPHLQAMGAPGPGPLPDRVAVPLRTRDGAPVWMEVSGREVHHLGRRLHLAVGTSAEEPAAHAALRASEERYRLVARATLDVIYDWDLVNERLIWSETTQAVFGFAPEVLGHDLGGWADRLHPDDRERVVADLTRAVEGAGEIWSMEYRFRRADGSYAAVLDRGSFIRDAGGRALRMIGAVMDQTVLRRVEEAARFLAEAGRVLASSLDLDTTLHNVTALAVPLLADWCSIHLCDDGGELRMIQVAHAEPEKEALAWELETRYPSDPEAEVGIAAVVRRGVASLRSELPEWVLEALARDDEHLRILRQLGLQSTMVVPLAAHGRVLGAITLVSTESGRRFTEDDLALAEGLAQRIALAVDNAHRYAAQQQARRAAERAAERTAGLHAVSSALSRAVTPEQVAQAALPPELRALGIGGGSIAVLSEDGTTLEVLGATGYRSGVLEAFARISLDARLPVSDAVRDAQPVWIPSAAEWRARYPHLAYLLENTPHHAWAAVPLLLEDQVIGAMGLSFAASFAFEDEDRDFILALAQLCAQALERARLYAEAQQASRAKSAFISVMSHEFRTPLASIVMETDLLEAGIAGPVTEEQRQELSRIRAVAWHLSHLVEEILSYSRLEAGAEAVRWERVEVAQVVREALQLIEPLAAAKQLALRSRVPEPMATLRTDRGKLRQILVNLLSNAVRFTDHGEIRVEARLGDAIDIEVTDTGVGISPEDQERIFQPFWQADQSMTRVQGGTGLGLSVSYQLARLLDGEITVRSAPGEGSTFTVRLPILRPEPT